MKEKNQKLLNKYTEPIFKYLESGNGNLVINAKAGSGKTTTILEGLKYLKPNLNILFIAFNKSIVSELKGRINNPDITVSTLHGLGYRLLRYHFNVKDIPIFEDKYRDGLYENIVSWTNFDFNSLKPRKYDLYLKNILTLCDLGRAYAVSSKYEMYDIALKYNIRLIEDECNIAMELIWWGEDNCKTIDFTDMIYLPSVLRVKPFRYDVIIVDEAQDLNVSQRELMLRCIKQGGRFIAVGDNKQCIYQFMGSDEDSFKLLQNQKNTVTLPLSVCYRCPKNVIEFVQKIVPDIEASDNAIAGFVDFKSNINKIQDNDMVLCRNNAPLLLMYYKLIENGKKCFIKGLNTTNLKDLLNLYENDYINENNENILIKFLHNNIINSVTNHCNTNKMTLEETLQIDYFLNLIDTTQTLENIIYNSNVETINELNLIIDKQFNSLNEDGICLSTIHKSKGLETDNIFILFPGLLKKNPQTAWEVEQEENLAYVAYTRPKKYLGFISKSSFYETNEDEEYESSVLKYYNSITSQKD